MNVILQSLVSTQARLVITSSESDSSTSEVLASDSICMDVPTDDIRAGDTVLVLPGETISVDVSLKSFHNALNVSSICEIHQSAVYLLASLGISAFMHHSVMEWI